MQELITHIVQNPSLHAKWLNTLSYLENCGARKIAACEHPTLVKEEMLKHAAEEFRHAHYLKSQMEKLKLFLPDYSLSNLLGGIITLRYLDLLEVQVCRYLIENQLPMDTAYILVTYAIEKRAEKFYPLYEEVLRKENIRIYVKSIILEEEEHLEEMLKSIKKIPSGIEHSDHICTLEEALFQRWEKAVKETLTISACPFSMSLR